MEDGDFLENKPKQPIGRRVRFVRRGKTTAKPEPEIKVLDLLDVKKPKTKETSDLSTPTTTTNVDLLPKLLKQEPSNCTLGRRLWFVF